MAFLRASLVAGTLVATALATGGPDAAHAVTPQTGAACANPDHPGGRWPSLNRDLGNTRFQAEERTIGVEKAPSLAPAWRFQVPAETGTDGGMQSTPIVANGCVYFAVGDIETPLEAGESLNDNAIWRGGTVFALNADTGELVWQTKVNGFALGLAEADGLVYALPSAAPEPGAPSGVPEPKGAHAVALDSDTGEMVWVSGRLDDDDPRNGRAINASPVVFRPANRGRPLLFVPLALGGGEGARLPLYFLDARTGKVVERFFALSEEDYAAGYGGAGIWTTAAFDPATNHLYAGTADSEGHRYQHKYNNAILKIDADPGRASFGSVVDAFEGTSEHYDLDRQGDWMNNPVCESDPTAAPNIDGSQSTACLELDLDFGSSPNLYTDSRGRKLVAALQKSGVLHVADTTGMDAAWSQVLSPPTEASNGATAATDGTDLFVSSFPDVMSSFERTSGSPNWVASTGPSALSYQPVTAANGVIYAITDSGTLVAFDAGTGDMLLHRPIANDAGVPSCFGAGAGTAIARNTVYAPCDAGAFVLPGSPGAIVAYRPAPSGG